MPLQAAEAFRMLETRASRNATPGDKPVRGYVNGFAFETIGGYAVAEGDMVMGKVDKDGRLRSQLRQRGLGQSRLYDRWPDGIVPYELLEELSDRQVERIEKAIRDWSKDTRVTLVQRTAENAADYPDYLAFQGGSGCASWVGRQGGPQAVWVAEVCPTGSIIHEIGHAMGLFHEHTRPDRDSYVNVVLNNIQSDKKPNFEILQAGIQTYGEYDFASIMHYGEYFFTNNGERTIEVPAGVTVGQRDALSTGDIEAINAMYGTDLSLSLSSNADAGRAEIYVIVTNQGDMGARSLVLDLELDDRTRWETSGNSRGWDCTASGQALQCRLPQLAADEVSRFTVNTGTLVSSTPSLSARLNAGTFDSNESNNSREHALPEVEGNPSRIANATAPDDTDNAVIDTDNDSREPVIGAVRPKPGVNAFTPMPDSVDGDENSGTLTPGTTTGGTIGAGNSDRVSPDASPNAQAPIAKRGGVAASTESSGGGSGHPVMALTLLALLGWRRRV